MKLEHGLINLKILFSKAQKLSDYIIFKSKLFHSITVDEKKKKRISKKVIFSTKVGNVISSSSNISFANARKYFEKILPRLTFKYSEKVGKFSIPSSFME